MSVKICLTKRYQELWSFNPRMKMFILLTGRCTLPKYCFSKFNCSPKPFCTICLIPINTYALENALKRKEK